MRRPTESGQKWVGVAGFEPTTSSSRTKRATGLRYTPMDRSTTLGNSGFKGGAGPYLGAW